MSTQGNQIAEDHPSWMKQRSKAPVFVLGCPRSGTTVLYHMLLSSGGFAVYRAESNVFNLLVPRFGNLSSAANRQKLMEYWIRSKLFRASGLDAREINAKIMAECQSGGDFLRIVMEETARKQGASRWADCTPDHLLYIPEIKRELPDALIIHIIRDGRDVALSYVKQGSAFRRSCNQPSGNFSRIERICRSRPGLRSHSKNGDRIRRRTQLIVSGGIRQPRVQPGRSLEREIIVATTGNVRKSAGRPLA